MNKAVRAAYHQALQWLTRREYCEVELRKRLLQREFDDIAIDSAIEELKQYGYLSESRYAESFLRSRVQKGDAPWMAAEKARQKGVDDVVLQQVLNALDRDYDAKAACLMILSKRDPQEQRRHDPRIWQRQARYLRNKGFDASTIVEALNVRNED